MIDLLSGVRILAVSQFGAGPFGSLHLADLGADVIKIENRATGGDVSRSVPPHAIDGDSLYFQSLNRNKRSVTLNLKHPEGQRVFRELAQVSDGVFCNLRGDLPQKLGLTYETLKDVNPQIVCCALTGFGLDGPRRDEPGYDYLFQAYAGWMSLTGAPSTPPTKSGLSMVDFSAGPVAMVGLLAGLLHARRTGVGCDVDVSLLDTAISMLNYVAAWTLNSDYEPQRVADSAHQTLYPAQVFETEDGYVVICCFKEKFWVELTDVIDAPELAKDPRYQGFTARYEYRDALIADLKARFRTRTTAEWLDGLRGRVPCAPVNSVREALRDEQVLAREMVVSVEHPQYGTIREVRTAIRVADGKQHRRPMSSLGADTGSILQDLLGYDENEVSRLREVGAV